MFHSPALILSLPFQNKHISSKYSTKHVELDIMLLLELSGKSADCSSVFESTVSSLDDLKPYKDSSGDARWWYRFYVYKMLIAFWKKKWLEAEEVNMYLLIFFVGYASLGTHHTGLRVIRISIML